MYMYYILGYKLIYDDDDIALRSVGRAGTGGNMSTGGGGGKQVSWAKTTRRRQKKTAGEHYTRSDIFDSLGEEFHVKVGH